MMNFSPNGEWKIQPDFKASEHWFKVAAFALLLGGLLSLVLVIGRLPYLSRLVTDPEFAKKCLVVHVDLAIYVWLLACLASAFSLIPAVRSTRRFGRYLPDLAIIGVIVFTLTAAIPGVKPILSNYIPALDHPLFFIGLGVCTIALILVFLSPRLIRAEDCQKSATYHLPLAARDGLRMAAAAFLSAVVTLLITYALIDPVTTVTVYYNLLFWGTGHVLQFSNTLGMMSAWLILIDAASGQTLISRREARLAFSLLIIPLLATAVLATQIDDIASYLLLFTRLMQFGIFPAVLLFLFFTGRGLIRTYRNGALDRSRLFHPAFIAFVVSASLSLAGMSIGAMIRSGNTLVPAHYHASIGAVTVAYMAMFFVLSPVFGYRIVSKKFATLSHWQPASFGLGQFIFAVGFATASMTRKVYGLEQIIRTPTEYFGLILMGLGALLAISGGLFFLWIVWAVWFHHHPISSLSERSLTWETMNQSISSKS